MQQQRKEAIVTLRGVAKEIPPLQYVADIVRNEFMPNVSTSRIIKSESDEGYHIFINIHQLPEYHPKVTSWAPGQSSIKQIEEVNKIE